MFYEFHNYKAKNINKLDLENMLDGVIDLYLAKKGAKVEDIVHIFQKQCICISKIKDENFKSKQKQEAVKRLEILQQKYSNDPNILKDFKDNEIIYCSEDKLTDSNIFDINSNKKCANAVKKIEKEWDILVYYCVLTHKADEEILTMLFVSDNEDDWEEEIETLIENDIAMYEYNLNNDESSQFGAVKIDEKDGKLIRTF